MGSSLPCCRQNYGNVIVVVCGVAIFSTLPGHSFGLNVFVNDIIQDLGLSRTELSASWTLGLLLSACLLPAVGFLAERIRRHTVLAILAPVFVLLLLAMGTVVSASWQLCMVFAGLRFIGPEAICMLSTTTLNTWFIRKRGRVSAAPTAFGGLMILTPPIVHPLILSIGWRHTYLVLAAWTACLLLFILIFFRDSPEQFGLKPDGDGLLEEDPRDVSFSACREEPGAERVSPTSLPSPTSSASALEGWTLRDALRTRVFWACAANGSLCCILWAGFNLHAIDVLVSMGIRESAAPLVFLPLTITQYAVTFGASCLIDRVENKHRLQALGSVMMVISNVLLAIGFVQSVATMFVFAVVYGTFSGLNQVCASVVYADLFGRKMLASIISVGTSILTASSAIGPFLYGAARDHTGRYDIIIVPTTSLLLIAALVLAVMGRPNVETSAEVQLGPDA